ncbi:hypothetical protein [Halobacillus dabanensis]|nr:hypothetical protein [Halobacillus dabanensis]
MKMAAISIADDVSNVKTFPFNTSTACFIEDSVLSISINVFSA